MERVEKDPTLIAIFEELHEMYREKIHYGHGKRISEGLAGYHSNEYTRIRVAGMTSGEMHVFNRELSMRIIMMTTAEQEDLHELLVVACRENQVKDLEIDIKWSRAGKIRKLHVGQWGQGLFDLRLE